MVMSYDCNYHICNTCHKALRNNRMPCQAVANKLEQEIAIAPGEGKQPISVLNGKFCEELAHLHSFL